MDPRAVTISIKIASIDFSNLMDLRIDYAFKLIFAKGAQPSLMALISLLNAIFANKKNQ